jgi:hypothetical protein
MSYAIRWALYAYHPRSLGSVTLSTLPLSYRERVEAALTKGTGQSYAVNVDWSNGLLNYGEDWSWRECDEAVRYLSQFCPELIWVVHALGEEHKQWALYAYAGVAYREDMPDWVPPLPNMARLPAPRSIPIPADPLNTESALRIAFDQMKHSSSCAAIARAPLVLATKCNCPYRAVQEALKAAEERRRASR